MLAELKARLREIGDLRAAGAVLSWDQATYMPPGGADARGRQMAMLSRLAHERLVAPGVGRLIEALIPYGESLPPGSDDAGLIRVARRDYEKAIKVPADYVARVSAHSAASYQAWTRARPANDFRRMVPYLEKTLDLSREYSEFFAPYAHIADPHIDDADEGMTTATIRKLFGELKRGLVPLVDAICAQPEADDSCLHRDFPNPAAVGFCQARRRADRLRFHSAAGSISRIIRSAPDFPQATCASPPASTKTISATRCFSTRARGRPRHVRAGRRCGARRDAGGHGVSAGVHESQSRLWENIVARSRGFWEYFYPPLQQRFCRPSLRACRSMPFTAPSTRWRVR